ncbi:MULTISPECIES: hypothetical protein [Psychrilyobacter]|uniref:Outer membrane protein beta-barrel domain-containing protein n=1 Tax=Psychrilyobacter piezotolerans TaxID=2293438 RepID=A0ABX9KFK5_9FUSO|nr:MULTISPECIES: hypothetical protein [Psychrilyobacter]MCS5421285.1 hypothetical protein [Psychrilyobacter sp. S5]NDI78148.1 hypothetical protein [Psychrilyobacter piezotolerans]RDE60160.1 hypothetical protein DV867_11495 [Psychrilyobacter sp. S5]REI40342.1 hypothetical protein DYH56_11495 [Psychrilyobacter piezotolerans]
MKKLILVGLFILGLDLYPVGINLGVGGSYGKFSGNKTGSLNLNLEIVHEIFPDIELGFGGIGEFNFSDRGMETFPVYLSGKFYSQNIPGLYTVGRYGRTLYKDSDKIGAYAYLGIGKKLESGLSVEGGFSLANQDTEESVLNNGNIALLLIMPIF